LSLAHTVSVQAPAAQVCAAAGVADLQRFAPSVQTLHTPAAQLPASAPTAHAVPSARLPMPHAPPVQVACRQGFDGAVHCEGAVHCTQVTAVGSQ
jgi:hypothetical protein